MKKNILFAILAMISLLLLVSTAAAQKRGKPTAATGNNDDPKKRHNNLLVSVDLAAPQQTREPCGREELKFFDPLLGEWKQRDGSAKMKITKILDGCVIQEVWEFADFSAVLLRNYDSRTKKWYLTFTAHDLVPQVWEGRLENGNWIFYRDWELDGKPRRSRTYWDFTNKGFFRIVQQLNDDGKTWRLHVRDIYQKRTPEKSPSD